MPFAPLSATVKPPNDKMSIGMTTMAKGGLNLRDLPEFMNPAFALRNENYLITTDGSLSKRKGLIKVKEIAGNHAITLFKYWKGYWIFAYDKTLAALNTTTLVVTNIKTNWNTSDLFTGAPYGDYFLVGNLGNKIHYVTEAAGVFTITEIAAAPMTGVLIAAGPRLYAGVGTDVYYSSIDDGSNPPFQNWAVVTTATGGGKVSFRNAGTINCLGSLGDIIVAWGSNGKFAFRITTQNDGTGTIVKIDEVVIDRIDMGGASGAITTPKGLYYVNSAGLWEIRSLGQPNIPFSDQERITSILLGTSYFTNINLTNCDLVWYARYNTVLVTCARGSVQNNHVIAYNTDQKSFSTFKNWNINRWMSNSSEIYGASSVKTALYHCFVGNADDGVNISTDYLQELKMSTMRGKLSIPTPLWVRQMLYGAYVKGFLSSESKITVSFDIYNVRGELEENKLSFLWTTQYNVNKSDGWGTAQWGESSWGGDVDESGYIESFDGMHKFIRNFQRIRVHITEGSKLPHEITWVSLDARPKVAIRRRRLKLITN